MSIIVTEKNRNAKVINKSPIKNEEYLQDYVHNNPEAIPIYEIQEDKRLFVVKREFKTNSGLIDALAVDQDGDIYIVETKLYKNPDKRLVVAQALDYGAALWKYFNNFEELISKFNSETQKSFGQSFEDKLAEFFELDQDQVEQIKVSIRQNLDNGNFKYVILMDQFDERLKDLIIYINQNSQFDIYAVQIEYYEHDNFEIMIPKIFGVEVKKSMPKTDDGKRSRYKRNENDFINQVSLLESRPKQIVFGLLEYSKNLNCCEGWGTGKIPVFSFKVDNPYNQGQKVSVFTVWADGTINIGAWLYKIEEDSPETIKEFFQKIDIIDGIQTKRRLKLKDKINFTDIPNESIDKFKETVLWLKDQLLLDDNKMGSDLR